MKLFKSKKKKEISTIFVGWDNVAEFWNITEQPQIYFGKAKAITDKDGNVWKLIDRKREMCCINFDSLDSLKQFYNGLKYTLEHIETAPKKAAIVINLNGEPTEI